MSGACRSCGRPFSPTHDVDAPGPTVRHPFAPKGDDLLVLHYVELVTMIEQLVLARVPRIPLMPAPKPLEPGDVLEVAVRFAAAHDVPRSR